MTWSIFLLILALSDIVLPLTITNINNQSITTLSPNYYLTVAIVFPPSNLTLLQQYVQEHVILNQTQVEKLFIPTEEISKTLSQLRQSNISATSYMNVILASGTVSQLEKALNGKFYVYELNGKRFFEFFGSPVIPNAIVIGTNITSLILNKPTTLYNVTQAVAYNALKPSQLLYAYNISWLHAHNITGKGTAIGILDFYGNPYIQQQLQEFDKQYNIPNPPFFKIVPIGAYNPNNGISTGWAMEISLDVEYAHVIAPDAGIVLYVANPNIPLPAIIAYIVQQDEVNVVSQSFGIPELYVDLGLIPRSYVNSLMYEYWLGEVEGISFAAASGDAGGNGYNYFLAPQGSVIFPASIPYVLAVGGSSVYIGGNKTMETAWSGESVLGASTGGYSTLFPAPWYQDSNGFRVVPDVVADANPYTGAFILYYYNQTYLVGGTSLATPIVSGIIDLMTQSYGKLGFVNPFLYELRNTSALSPIGFGYNTPYYVNSSELNPVTGLGSINAGYLYQLLPKVIHSSSISVGVNNITYLDGQVVKVVANITGIRPSSVIGIVYNGSSVVQQFSLSFNGTYWVGEFVAEGSGIEEVIVKAGNLEGSTYVTIGYQAQFIFPPIALFPEPEPVPIVVQLIYPNGSLVRNPSNLTALIYKYDQMNNKMSIISSVQLQRTSLINLSILGIQIESSYLTGVYQLPSNIISGVYFIKIPNVFGFDEFVSGIYILDAVYPPVFTNPVVLSPGQNVTILAEALAIGSPNVTVTFYNISGNKVYSIPVNAITYQNTLLYITQITLPKLKPGYYYVVTKAIYNASNFTAEGVGLTQIYVSPYSLNVKVRIIPNNSIVYQNQQIYVIANITYPNGTEVKYGSFSAIIVPSYLSSQFDNLQLQYSVPLTYINGSWIGQLEIPSGSSTNSLGYSTYGISGYWDVYVEGISADGIPTNFPATLDVNTLSINPISPSSQFVVLPYVYVSVFNGTIAFNEFIDKAIVVGHNATFINSIIRNLIVENGTVTLINSKVQNVSLVNSEIIKINSTVGNNVNYITTIGNNHAKSSYPSLDSGSILTIGIVLDIITIIALILIKRRKKFI
ncbi:peptidase S53 [Saccharolobus solfataricus]|uniref:Peptidase S53 n=2 Tax=Saccharolobus solfataricus TaxID=2287 RepID=A0A3G8DRM1_SACSO|nr:protease pro-enzyme activation domain-containing protein [Saccharolobus solfataricus]AZF69438.1 peptidase S53 [Saccharolobus solfataricus]AZF72058.1 peptidase S53 [Saccharolobus solfataricus]AZF74678.1 peptidase S53 [Saccharolobus solfataricus]AZF77289.1 peptidase S53 [Saccharolobus solfataricus]AZF79894.1 peptidase S53 [Saccharolobus solfataricus]